MSGTLLIVGAGDYTGTAIARRFHAGGWTVCMGRRRGDLLDPLVAEMQPRAYGFAMDARSEESVKAAFAYIEEEIGPLDAVICNVGGNVRFPIQETTTRVFTKVWEMACLAGFLSAREAADYMVPRGRGSIFFTGATASMRGGSGFAAFAAAKAGQRALAQSMARELGPEGIHVAHLVVDAAVETEWTRAMIRDRGQDPDRLPPDTLMDPASVAETYWMLHHQPKDAWTFEMDLRPHRETW